MKISEIHGVSGSSVSAMAAAAIMKSKAGESVIWQQSASTWRHENSAENSAPHQWR